MISNINIVTNMKIVPFIKKSRYFKTNLGLAVSVQDRKGDRILNQKDKFCFYYYKLFKQFPYAQGNIGNIRIYIDHTLFDPILKIYYDNEEFPIKFDEETFKEKGMDWYLGTILKKIETDHMEAIEKKKKEEEELSKEEIPKGNANKLFTNPGAVTYEDLQAYIEQKNKKRFG